MTLDALTVVVKLEAVTALMPVLDVVLNIVGN